MDSIITIFNVKYLHKILQRAIDIYIYSLWDFHMHFYCLNLFSIYIPRCEIVYKTLKNTLLWTYTQCALLLNKGQAKLLNSKTIILNSVLFSKY